MPNSIAFAKSYIPIIDEVYQNASVSRILTSSGRIVRSTHNAREIMIPKISVSGLGDYTRDQGYEITPVSLTGFKPPSRRFPQTSPRPLSPSSPRTPQGS